MRKLTVFISGMHCASCAVNIEEVLKKTKGVLSASINFASQKATITYDPEIITKHEIEKNHFRFGI